MHNPNDYTFEGLRGSAISDSLSYLIGLVNAPDHQVSDPRSAKGILIYLFDIEEQMKGGADLIRIQEGYFEHWSLGGYYPQTPCMLTKGWSPIAAMLGRGFAPRVLAKQQKPGYAAASGIWEPCDVGFTKAFDDCETAEELFWALMDKASNRARTRLSFVSLIACPGWSYEFGIDSLPRWPSIEVAAADRMIWRRTPDDAH